MGYLEEEINSNIHLMERAEMFQEQFEEYVQIMEMTFTEHEVMEKEDLK